MTRYCWLLLGYMFLVGCGGSKPTPTELVLDLVPDRNFDEEAENKAIEQVKTLGGSCHRAKSGEAINEITFKSVKLHDDDLAVLKSFPKLTGLTIQNCPGLTGAGFKYLADTPKLSLLQLAGGTLNSNTFQALVHAPHLRFLALSRMTLAVEDAERIAKLKELQTLELVDITLMESHLKPLSELPELMELMLRDTGLAKETAQAFVDRVNKKRPKDKPRLGISF